MRPAFLVAASLAALTVTIPSYAQAQDTAASAQPNASFDRFTPKPNPIATRIDYTIWDEALNFMVFRMGRSIREGAPRVDPSMGTRRIYGHDSRLRLEGNRVIFSFLEENVIQSLTEYRQDLERTADQVDISRLSRNEQLAFWTNLHNAAVIEQIAINYPLSRPSGMKIGPERLPLDEARFITVNGVAMSPKDIRTRIVYPNWKDPKVIYGFWRGEIGGPSIRDVAFTAANAGELLDEGAREFVNALRGTEKRGDTLHVSRIFAEAAPFYFTDFERDVKAHIAQYANDEVKPMLAETSKVEPSIYDFAVADLANGEREPSYSNVVQSDRPGGEETTPRTRIPGNIQRLVTERGQKLNKIIRRGERTGTVTFIGIDLPGQDNAPEEVE
uniref:DUF547 domain-containing protein n=1 Tax=Parerythrobacter lutipelagi TaxID=1964208 RepID=UPI0010F8CBA8|nr:DUF547 domain-containing protein [Parerythrobacter lutipelagi]